MAQTLLPIQVIQDQTGTRIFIRLCTEILVSNDTDILYLYKNAIEVV